MAKEEAEGLNEEHQREDNAHSRRRLGVELTHKEGVGHVV